MFVKLVLQYRTHQLQIVHWNENSVCNIIITNIKISYKDYYSLYINTQELMQQVN